ncbi:serine/threonine-protein kinase Nek7-like isoform X2 [Haemaphysalis longicornis]
MARIAAQRVLPFSSPAEGGGGVLPEQLELVHEIGKGSFSVVYKARCTGDGSLVALKRVQVQGMRDERARADCIREAALLQKLQHPHIVKYYVSFVEKDELNIVLELADGGDLAQLIQGFGQQGKLIPEPTIWRYFSQVCAALKHMHMNRIMHRVGTPYYMSPERVLEQEYEYSSDIWSAGCLLYEMAALHSPFVNDARNLFSLLKKIVSSEFPPIPSNLYSDELRALVAVCMDPDPMKRRDAVYASAVASHMCQRWSALHCS